MGESVCGWYLDIQPGGDLERSPGQLPGYGRRCSEKIWSGAYKRRCVWCQCHDACYMPFNKEGELMVPFRTWRNNITGEASEKLAELFHYNIPQRWSIAHLYQAILNGEEHVKDIDYITTLEAMCIGNSPEKEFLVSVMRQVCSQSTVKRRTITRRWFRSSMNWLHLMVSHGASRYYAESSGGRSGCRSSY